MKNIDSDMQAFLDQMAKFNSPPIETLDYSNARNTPTFNNAVEEMASQSATTRACQSNRNASTAYFSNSSVWRARFPRRKRR
ncbi:MAG: hypothetical protein M3R11_10865 [Acidobacteriota bacterium]|nr:hypothetical protein [Acidobacteriota bacterium]